MVLAQWLLIMFPVTQRLSVPRPFLSWKDMASGESLFSEIGQYLLWVFGSIFIIIELIVNWLVGFGLIVAMGRNEIPISRKLWILVCIPFAFPVFSLGVMGWFAFQALWASLTEGVVEIMFPELVEMRLAKAYGYSFKPEWMKKRNAAVLEMLRAWEKENMQEDK